MIAMQGGGKQSELSKVLFLRRLYELILGTNVTLRISGNKPLLILNISVAKT